MSNHDQIAIGMVRSALEDLTAAAKLHRTIHNGATCSVQKDMCGACRDLDFAIERAESALEDEES